MQLAAPGRCTLGLLHRSSSLPCRFRWVNRQRPVAVSKRWAICPEVTVPEVLNSTTTGPHLQDSTTGCASDAVEIVFVGLNVKNAPALTNFSHFADFARYQQLDNSLYLAEDLWPEAIHNLCSCPEISEAAVLLTCQRKEVYVVSRQWNTAVEHVVGWLAATAEWQPAELLPMLVVLRGADAIDHLMRVAAGLESLVLGEGRILAEVKQAWLASQGHLGFGPVLSALFRQSVTLGKRVRTETAIGTGSMSIAAAAVEKARRTLPKGQGMQDACVCVVGAGRMAGLIARHLLAKGIAPRRLLLVNRTQLRARQLCMQFPEVPFEVLPLKDLAAAVAACDVTFFAIGTSQPLLSRGDLASMARPASRVRRLIDVSLPPAVDTAAKGLKGVALHDDTDLLELVVASRAERQAASAEASVLVAEELAAFQAWTALQEAVPTTIALRRRLRLLSSHRLNAPLTAEEAVPTIKALRRLAEAARQEALAEALAGLDGELTPRQLAVVEEMSQVLVAKLLHGPLAALRQDRGKGGEPLRHSMQRLFEL